MWIFNPNFKKVFSFFRLIPAISTFALGLFTFIWAIVDAKNGFIFDFEVGFFAFILWLIIGAVTCAINFCSMVLLMAPMMAKFDAIMDIRNKVLGEETPKVAVPNVRPAKPRATASVRNRPDLEIFDGSVTPPPVRTEQPKPQAPQLQTPKQPLETHWICPSCNKKNLRIMTKCVYCHTEKRQ